MKTCPICRASDTQHLFNIAPSAHYGLDLPTYGIFQCCRCGYKVASPPPEPEILEQIYNQGFFQTSQQDVPVAPDGRLMEQSYQWPILKNARSRVQMLRRMRPTGSLLDVGCGKGFFVKAASRYYQAVGVEVSSYAAACGRRLGLDIMCGDFRTMDFGDRHFDIITFWDVLACMYDPAETVQRVCGLLAPGGIMVATVPDGGSLAARWLGKYWPLMIPPINVGFYTRRSAERLAENCGLHLLEYTHYGKWTNVGFLLLKLKRTLRLAGPGSRSAGSGRKWSIFLNLRDIATAIFKKT